MPAHPVAHHQQGVETCLVAPDDYCVLVLLALQTGIGRPCDPKTHLRSEYREVHRVLADGDPVAVTELLLLDRLAVDKRPVGAAQVDDPELIAAPLEAGVMTARCGVTK